MFTLGRGVYNELVRKDEHFVAVVGLDGAGKTTYVEQLKANLEPAYKKRTRITSTVGLNLVRVECGSRDTLCFWDVGGERSLRPLWKTYLEGCNAVVFVVDAAEGDPLRCAELNECIEQLQSIRRVAEVPLLFLLNKCDLLQPQQEPREAALSSSIVVGDTQHNKDSGGDLSVDEEDDNCSSTTRVLTAYDDLNDAASSSSTTATTTSTSTSSVVTAAVAAPPSSTTRTPASLCECLYAALIAARREDDADAAVLSISARENANVAKSARWLLDALLAAAKKE